MKRIYLILLISCAALVSCEGFLPESKIDTSMTEDIAGINYTNLYKEGIEAYAFLPKGFDRIDGAMLASACDEADHAIAGSSVEKFQLGTWSALSSPNGCWTSSYQGIRRIRKFLADSENYPEIIVRDTSTTTGLTNYLEQCEDLKCLRAENHVMLAYLYFELLKRYGGVPIVTEEYSLNSSPNLIRSSYGEVVALIISEIDNALADLKDSWQAYKPNEFGRIEKGAALAIKSRALLYAASPAYNASGDLMKWKNAAAAAKAVIDLNRYSLASDYRAMFLGVQGHQNSECILACMTGENNAPETSNYPVTINGGNTGTCPSGNLVDAYEYADGTEFSWATLAPGADPYAGRDPRLQQTVVVNGSVWNSRAMEIYTGGRDGIGVENATTTGYYLKKFLTDDLDLDKDQTAVHSWPLFRYAEILLNYAEAMNEAYGADVDYYGDGRTARWAINQVRMRAGMPNVVATTQADMRKCIRHERQIELAFEEHRFYDVRRWGDAYASTTVGAPLKGVRITKVDDVLSYAPFDVENRVWRSHMVLFPIPQSEILASDGLIAQNPGW